MGNLATKPELDPDTVRTPDAVIYTEMLSSLINNEIQAVSAGLVDDPTYVIDPDLIPEEDLYMSTFLS